MTRSQPAPHSQHLQRYLPAGLYLGLACLILGPLLLPGYILTFDLIATPHLNYPLDLNNLLPFHWLMNALNLVLPGQILEKLLLLAIFTLAGLGLHRLLPVSDSWARYAAGLFYVINPFTYARFMTGQYLVLAGYALLPWFIAALIRLVRTPRWGTAVRAGGWLLAISFLSIHYLGFAFLATVLASLLGIWRHLRQTNLQRRSVAVPPSPQASTPHAIPDPPSPRSPHLAPSQPLPSQPLLRLPLVLGAVVAAILLLNAFWIVPTLAGRTSTAHLVAAVDDAQLLTFRTQPDPVLGLAPAILALSGMWTDRQDLYRLPRLINPIWWLVTAFILVLAGMGAVAAWRHRYRLDLALVAGLALIGFVLALGIQDSPLAPLNHWLFNHLALLRGYREPGKFIGLLALAQAYCLGWGAHYLQARWRRPLAQQLIPGLLLALPLTTTPTMLWAAGGQLAPVHYPADWVKLSRRLAADPHPGPVLFLPWHEYLQFSFSNGRLIANPARSYFGPRIIQGDNPEIGLIQSGTPDPAASPTTLAAAITRRHLQYIVLARATDANRYAWINHQPGLELVSHTPILRLYRVTSYVPGGQP